MLLMIVECQRIPGKLNLTMGFGRLRYVTLLCVKIILIQTQYKCLFILSFNVDFGYGWMRLIRCSLWPALIAQKI